MLYGQDAGSRGGYNKGAEQQQQRQRRELHNYWDGSLAATPVQQIHNYFSQIMKTQSGSTCQKENIQKDDCDVKWDFFGTHRLNNALLSRSFINQGVSHSFSLLLIISEVFLPMKKKGSA
jgi:hypothetical protein